MISGCRGYEQGKKGVESSLSWEGIINAKLFNWGGLGSARKKGEGGIYEKGLAKGIPREGF